MSDGVAYMAHVAGFMSGLMYMFLFKLNNDKTELIVFKNKFQLKDHEQACLNINDCEIVSSTKVKNLGVVFDEDLSMTAHVNSVYKSIIFHYFS